MHLSLQQRSLLPDAVFLCILYQMQANVVITRIGDYTSLFTSTSWGENQKSAKAGIPLFKLPAG